MPSDRANRRFLTVLLLAAGLFLAVTPPMRAQSLSPLAPRWSPLGPSLINNGQGIFRRIPVTGRVNAVAPNPFNPTGDVWVGSATGGVWHGGVSPTLSWQPVADDAPTLAVGDVQLDSCSAERCATVWVGTGENGIRRDTQHGRGVLKFTWNPGLGRYRWKLLGEDRFARGSIARLVLDPRTPDDERKTLFVALSSGVTANASQSTVTTVPPSPFGIWRSRDAGRTWSNVLPSATPATDLEIDPQAPDTMFAGLRRQGIFKSTDGGNTWQPLGDGIPPDRLAFADWPEIAVFRTPGMAQPIVYAALGQCPHPHTKDLDGVTCNAAVYRSDDGGAHWREVHLFESDPDFFFPFFTYASYTHVLTVHPTDPETFWYGGLYPNLTTAGGDFFDVVGVGLHSDQHALAVWPAPGTLLGVQGFAATDGGLAFGDGIFFDPAIQQGLAVTQFQSIAASPRAGFLIGGTQDNGTNLWLGTDVWEHLDDGDAGATLIDLDDPGILYDNYFGTHFRRCAAPTLCKFLWPDAADGIAAVPDVSWYPPLVQDPTPWNGQHPLYAAADGLYRSLDDGASWSLVTPAPPAPPLGGMGTVAELGGIRNPISAVAVSPSNRNRLYVGYYDGQLFTTADAGSAHPAWTRADLGLPAGRPVTSLAVHPLDDRIALAAFSGFGQHAVYATATAGSGWLPVDGDGALARGPVNALLIEPRFPHRVWAGTDDGVWTSPLPLPVVGLWERSPGLPNVAVYDLEMAGDGESLLAATHGRGVWRFSATPVARAHAVAEEGGPAGTVWIGAAGFDPGERCTMTVLEGGRTCATSATSATDAAGASLSTDGRGFLVAARAGDEPRALAWACKGGLCAGGAACAASEVRVTCGGRTAAVPVPVPADALDPESTRLSFAAEPAAGGSFTVAARLRRTDGAVETTTPCAGTVAYEAGEDAGELLERAARSLEASPGCRQAGVSAKVSDRESGGGGEDEGPRPAELQLEAPLRSGERLVTELTAAGPGSFTVDGYASLRGISVPPRLTLSGTAAGGRLEVAERSPLGTCTVSVATAAGEPAEAVAARLHAAFLAADGAPGSCLSQQNPRDAERAGAALRFPLGRQLTVTNADPGLGFTIAAGR